MRFTQNFIHELRTLVKEHHTLGVEFDKFLSTDFQMGSDIGCGTRYIGIGGRASVEYGPKGARKVVGYLYGMGAASGALTKLEARNRYEWDRFFTAVDKARVDIGQEEFDAWTQMGRESVERFHKWSAMGD